MNTAITVPRSPLNKVPEVTLSFWIIKIMSTTVGETGADFWPSTRAGARRPRAASWPPCSQSALFVQLRTRRYTAVDLLADRGAGQHRRHADHGLAVHRRLGV